MDFGFPQYTEAKILSEFIKTDAYRMEVTQRPPMAVTNAVSWRSEGIRYKKNEVGSIHSLSLSLFCFLFIYCCILWSFFPFLGVLGCGGKCEYTCQQQWTNNTFRCCWGSKDENIFEVHDLSAFLKTLFRFVMKVTKHILFWFGYFLCACFNFSIRTPTEGSSSCISFVTM